METSDSEYFESADEDFEPESQFINKNITAVSKTSHTLAQEVHKRQILSDVNTKDQENSNTKDVSHSSLISLQEEVSGNSSALCVNQDSVTNVKKNDKFLIQDRVTKRSSIIDECKASSPKVTDDECHIKNKEKPISPYNEKNNCMDDESEENVWNEGEGWGMDDSDSESSTKILTDNSQIEGKLQHLSINEEPVKKDKDLPKKFTTQPLNDKNVQHFSKKEELVEGNNMWETDDWESWEEISDEKIQESTAEPNAGSSTSHSSDNNSSNGNRSWKAWGNWGVNSILSTASQSVSTLTNSVSQGFSTVLETNIGAPAPEELAALNKKVEEKFETEETLSTPDKVEAESKNLLGFDLSNIGSLVSEVSKLVETTGSKVITGGLDTLETIGKKTMQVIQDGDPGLKRKRAFLSLEGEKPVLSQVLREAKEKAEKENESLKEKHLTRKVNYESIFDDHQGLVHLEALEMLSKQCDMKLQLLIESSTAESLLEIQETLDQVKELCELPDDEEEEQMLIEELKEKLKSAVQELNVNISYDKLISLWEETESWLNNMNLNICDENEIHQQAVETLAQLTAIAVEQFHKAGELLLIKDHHSTADEADSLVQLTTTLTSLIGIVAAKFSDKMNTKVTETSQKENINSLITNIFLEAANSSSYIQDAFQLLVPVLQMGAV